MNDNTIKTLIALIPLAIIVLLLMFLLSKKDEVKVTEVIASDDDPVLKQISGFRTKMIDEILHVFAQVWNTSVENMQVDGALTDWNNSLISIFYDNYTIRLYINWKSNKIRISFLLAEVGKDIFLKEKTVRFSHHTVDYAKLLILLQKWHNEALNTLYDDENDLIISCVETAKEIVLKEENTNEKAIEMMLDVWEHANPARDKKHIQSSIADYIKLVVFILKFYPEKFLDRIKKLQDK